MTNFTITEENQKTLKNINEKLNDVARSLTHDVESVAYCYGFGTTDFEKTTVEQRNLMIMALDMDKQKYEIIHQIYGLQAEIKALQISAK